MGCSNLQMISSYREVSVQAMGKCTNYSNPAINAARKASIFNKRRINPHPPTERRPLFQQERYGLVLLSYGLVLLWL